MNEINNNNKDEKTVINISVNQRIGPCTKCKSITSQKKSKDNAIE